MPKIFGSDIFTIETTGEKTQVHVSLSGSAFTARDLQAQDKPSFKGMFQDPKVTCLYGDGALKDEKWVDARFETWTNRFASGQPHGALTILDKDDTQTFIGFIVAGAGDDKGVSEVAFATRPEFWKKGIMSELLGNVVENWGSEVRAFGTGEKSDPQFLNLKKSFSCFSDGPLFRFDATHSPVNIGSGRVLKKNKFIAAESKVDDSNPFDLTTGDELSFAKETDSEAIKAKFFNKVDGKEDRKVNTRYVCIDETGEEKTVSYKSAFNAFRFHVERKIGEPEPVKEEPAVSTLKL